MLGGKGANLGEMTRIGVPVPPGFTITTEACNAYLAAGEEFPAAMWDQVHEALEAIEEATGKSFGDPDNPLLVSCRSGAKFSMPGMMDTVLNIGLNDEVVDGLIELTGDAHFVYDSYRRLIQMFGSVVLGVRDEPFEDVLERYRTQRGVANDADLTTEDFKAIAAGVQGHRRALCRPSVPERSRGAAPARDRGRVPLLERQAGHRLPQRGGHRPRPRHRREHPDDGVRQHGRRLRHRASPCRATRRPASRTSRATT